MANTETQQQLIVKTWVKIIDDCKSVEELLWQPISWKIACYSPEELTDERKQELLKHYDERLLNLKENGKQWRFDVRMQEAINEL